jgi:Tfp pilus assembly protein PilX
MINYNRQPLKIAINPGKQGGYATLFVSVILLLGITVISLSSSRLGVLELFASNNYESRHVAFNTAESKLDAMYRLAASVVDLNDSPGTVYCTANQSYLDAHTDLYPDCNDDNSVSSVAGWPSGYSGSEHEGQVFYERIGCAPRAFDTSCAIQFSHYVIRSVYDDRSNNGGISQTVTGVMELVPVF